MQIVIDGLLTHYRLQGKGRLVLLLHGWGDSAKGLAGLQAGLTGQYRVLAVDLPGFGASEVPPNAWKLDDYAYFVKAVIDKLDLDRPYAVIGHSNGGAVAIRAVSLKAVQPDKLVLLAAAGVRTGRRLQRGLLQVVAKTGNLATLGLPARYRQTLRQSLYRAAGSDLLVVPGMEATFKQTVRQDVQADAAQLDVPVLLIYGADDQAVPLSVGRRYHQLIKHSQLEIINRAGHFIHLDEPERVLHLIKEFLA